MQVRGAKFGQGIGVSMACRVAEPLDRLRRIALQESKLILSPGEVPLAGVFALTAALTSVPPPGGGHGTGADGAAHEAAPGRMLRMWAGSHELAFQVTPAQPGTNLVELRIASEADGTPKDVLRVTLGIDNPALGVEEISRAMDRVETGRYVLRGPEFAAPGRWRVRIELLVSDFEKRTTGTSVDIGSGQAHPEGR